MDAKLQQKTEQYLDKEYWKTTSGDGRMWKHFLKPPIAQTFPCLIYISFYTWNLSFLTEIPGLWFYLTIYHFVIIKAGIILQNREKIYAVSILI